MNVILLTILLTLLGSWLIVLLVWLTISAWKFRKFKKCTLSRLSNFDESMTTMYNNMYSHVDEVVVMINKSLEEIKTQLNDEVSHIYKNSNSTEESLKKKIKEQEKELNDYISINYNDLSKSIENLSYKIDDKKDKEPSFIFNSKKKKKK
jgi:hypothetical protein